jgi:aconitate hydratase
VAIRYAKLAANLEQVRKHKTTPLTLAEKIVYSHLDDPTSAKTAERGKTYLKLRPGKL